MRLCWQEKLTESRKQKRLADARTKKAAANRALVNKNLNDAQAARKAESGANSDALAKGSVNL